MTRKKFHVPFLMKERWVAVFQKYFNYLSELQLRQRSKKMASLWLLFKVHCYRLVYVIDCIIAV